MKRELLLELVKEGVGYIKPSGDFFIDKDRFYNQEKLIEIVMTGIKRLMENAEYRDNDYGQKSIVEIRDRALDALVEIHDLIIEVVWK